MTKHFNADFYVTCATVIPVLYLAVAVQGRTYESVLRASRTVAQSKVSERWPYRTWRFFISRFLDYLAFSIVFFGVWGEVAALIALYKGSERGQQPVVFMATLILLATAAAGPLLAWFTSDLGPPQAAAWPRSARGSSARHSSQRLIRGWQ